MIEFELKQKMFKTIVKQILRNINAKPKFDIYDTLDCCQAEIWSVGSKIGDEKPMPILSFELTEQKFEVLINGYFGKNHSFVAYVIQDNLANPNLIEDVRTKISNYYINTIQPWIKSKPLSIRIVLDERWRIIQAI